MYGYIVNPVGHKVEFHIADPHDWPRKIAEDVLPRWIDFCNRHWMSINHEDTYCSENRVKRFLDRCGTLFLYGQSGIETQYKEMQHTVHEIPMSDCPPSVENLLYSSVNALECDNNDAEERMDMLKDKLDQALTKRRERKKAEPVETKFDRAQRIRSMYPYGKTEFAVVNTDGDFLYNGIRLSVAEFEQYKPKQTDSGLLYDMDHVLVCRCGNEISLYDQDIYYLKTIDLDGEMNGEKG